MSSQVPRLSRRTSTGEPHKRRPNACEPCRNSKSRCDGGHPCTQCTKKRVKPQCIYRLQQPGSRDDDGQDGGQSPSRDSVDNAHIEGGQAASQSTAIYSDTTEPPEWTQSMSGLIENSNALLSTDACYTSPSFVNQFDLFGQHALAKCIDEFKLILPNEDQKMSGAVSKCHGEEVFNMSQSDATQADHEDSQHTTVTPLQPPSISSSMNQLPLSNLIPPYIIKLHKKALDIEALVRRGRLVTAWLELPRVVREAQCLGLHKDQDDRPMSYMLEAECRRRVWWHLLELDSEISLHVGQPLTIRQIHSVARPFFTENQYRTLEQHRLDFRQFLLEVLDKLFVPSHLSDGTLGLDEQWLRSQLPRLSKMYMKLPPIPPRPGPDAAAAVAIADYQIQVHVLELLLCCTLARIKPVSVELQTDDAQRYNRTRQHQSPLTPRSNRLRSASRLRMYAFQKEILQAARRILDSFEYIHEIDRSETGTIWTRCFGAYCAATILAIARIRQETELDRDTHLLRRATDIFQSLSSITPNSGLFLVASQRLGTLLDELHKFSNEILGHPAEDMWASDVVMTDDKEQTRPEPQRRRAPTTSSAMTTPRGKRTNRHDESGGSSPHKRQRIIATQPMHEPYFQHTMYDWQNQPQGFDPQLGVSFTTIGDTNDSFTTSSFSESFHTSGAISVTTSFTETLPLEPHPPLWPATNPDGMNTYPFLPENFHPPMLPLQGWDIPYGMPTSGRQHMPHDQGMVMTGLPGSQTSMLFPLDTNHVLPTSALTYSPQERHEYGPVSAGATMTTKSLPNAAHNTRGQQLEFHNETTETIRNPESGNLARARSSRVENKGSNNAHFGRRQSMADFRGQGDVTWTMENPAKWTEEGVRGKLRMNKDINRSPREQFSEGSRTPTTMDTAKDGFEQVDANGGGIRRLIPPTPVPGVEGSAVRHSKALQMQYSRPGSSEGSSHVSKRSRGVRDAGVQIAPSRPPSQVNPQDMQGWVDPNARFNFDGSISASHDMVLAVAQQSDSLQEPQQQMQAPVIATGPYERPNYSGWYG